MKVRNDPMQSEMAMHQAPRCGAKTRDGSPCEAPAVRNSERCRMHGGTEGSGGQPGNQNALKHGRYSKETLRVEEKMKEIFKQLKED